jgi:hypothetical protein
MITTVSLLRRRWAMTEPVYLAIRIDDDHVEAAAREALTSGGAVATPSSLMQLLGLPNATQLAPLLPGSGNVVVVDAGQPHEPLLSDVGRVARFGAEAARQKALAAERLVALQQAVTSTPYTDLAAAQRRQALLEAELEDMQGRLADVEAFKASVLDTVRALKQQIAALAVGAARPTGADSDDDE